MFQKIFKVFKLKDLRGKILFTFLLLVICRLLAHIPIPGVDADVLAEFFNRNRIFGILNMLSGGTMSSFSIVMMGVAPYISASIIIQLLTTIVPSLEALAKEGEIGRQKLNQYTRWLTLPLAMIQAYGMVTVVGGRQKILPEITNFELFTIIISVSAGTIFLMWLGELITEKGVGNGISLIITLGIISRIPVSVRNTVSVLDPSKYLIFVLLLLLAAFVIFFIIVIQQGERRIPICYARRIRGMRIYGGGETYLPIRVNTAGVIPIIFALSIMIFPAVIARFFTSARTPFIASLASYGESLFQPNTIFYIIIYFLLVFAFTFFYTAVVFNPSNISETIQKQGGFIPGIRPGKQTADYLSKVITRITLFGGIFLGIIAILPLLVQRSYPYFNIIIGGTGLLIVVSVILETARQIEAHLAMRTYEQY